MNTLSADQALGSDWDVIIIGAGPAGSFCAFKLADYNLRILLIDKETHPRPKVCGACISPLGVSFLEEEGLRSKLPPFVELQRASIFSRGKRITYPLQGGIAIDRALLDEYLIQCATKKNVSILYNVSAKLSSITPEHARVTLKQRGKNIGEISTKIVVGAFGLSGLTAEYENPEQPSVKNDSYIGLGAISSYVVDMPPATIFMALGQNGYVGGVRLANGTLDSAAALSPKYIALNGGINESLVKIIAEAGLTNILRPDLNWKGTPLLTRSGTIAAPRYFAVGDACGYVEPFTGEGISWALESAKLAAPIIAKASVNWQPHYLNDWKFLYSRTIFRRKKLCSIIQKVLRTPPLVRETALQVARVTLLSRSAGYIISGSPLSWL